MAMQGRSTGSRENSAVMMRLGQTPAAACAERCMLMTACLQLRDVLRNELELALAELGERPQPTHFTKK